MTNLNPIKKKLSKVDRKKSMQDPSKLLADTRLLIEPKIDGCAVALQYRDGTLEKAISRKGTDITSKIINVQGIPNLSLIHI